MPIRILALTLLIATTLPAVPLHAAEEPLVGATAIWKYLDNGTDQGTAWRQPGFNDSSWLSGPAELGYGDGDEATVVGFGPDSSRKYITTYFRHTFNVADPAALTSLKARLIRDDGAVVFINGTEAWRNNMTSSGTITYTTPANWIVGTIAEERTWVEKDLSPSLLRAGTNTVAVEVHQSDASSSDVSFALELIGAVTSPVPTVIRGPYLQVGTPNSITIRWRTDNACDSRVRFGSSPGSLTAIADEAASTTEHSVTLTGLTPNTRYYYSVGTSATVLAGGDATHTFVTAPAAGQALPTRIWVIGDYGTANTFAAAVRDAYQNLAGTTSTNVWLTVGDNAYTSGTDLEFEKAVFDMYPELLRSSVFWPSIGNHDTAESTTHSATYPYYNNFTLPSRGEAGGVPSGTESYYSFDYANIHFIALDAQTSDRSPDGPMVTWLKNDLAANLQQWTIAYWHHPPYTKGSHDSDVSWQLLEMRENVVPVLEAAGVDVILGGHSHAYERSFLLDGHYGLSSTFQPSMKKDGGDGREGGTGPYRKADAGPHEGTVYVVTGASGMSYVSGPLNHPAMYTGVNNLGSLVLDVSGDRLDARYLYETGVIGDSFTIIKGAPPAPQPPAAASALTASARSSSSIGLSWLDNATDEQGYRITRCSGASCTSFTQIAELPASVTAYIDDNLAAATTYRYRVTAYNAAGTSDSNIAEAATQSAPVPPAAPTALTATAASTSSITLRWSDNATDENGYRVARCTGASCTNFADVAQLAPNTTTWSDSGLTASTLYRYRVSAYNGNGTSVSNIAEATTQSAPVPPAAPTALTATAASTSSISLNWTDNATEETGYRVARCTGASCTNFTDVAQLAANITTWADSGLTAATLYRYRVVAFSTAGGTSAPSNVAEATTLSVPPAAPTNLVVSPLSAWRVGLAWNDNATNESGYRIERCIGGSCTNFTQIGTVGTNVRTYADTTTTKNTYYRYRVRAFNQAGTSGYSNIAAGRTPSK